MADEKKKQRLNVLVFGPQHAGKSSFINTTYCLFKNSSAFLPAETGRNATRGTTRYRIFKIPNSSWRFFDTAGRRFINNPDDVALHTKIMKGIPNRTDLVTTKSWMDAKVKPKNKIDHCVFVVNARSLQHTKVVKKNSWIEWLLPWSKSPKQAETKASVTKISYFPFHYKWFEDRLGTV